MGVKAALKALYDPHAVPVVNTLTAADLAQSPDDMRGLLAGVELMMDEAVAILNRVHTVMTAAGDAANATTVNSQITALS